jgi:hypothetical protein
MSASILRPIAKLGHFVGRPSHAGPPVFVNSMPKAGTNILEALLVALGYKRNWARCLNETNFPGRDLLPVPGRFYVGHLLEDDRIHDAGFRTVFLTRSLHDCLESYVNYMFIDTRHPVSAFLRQNPTIATVRRLYFTSDNPNGRPLIDEYRRFLGVDAHRYDVRLDFEDLVAPDAAGLTALAAALEVPAEQIRTRLRVVLEADGYTKNDGRFDILERFEPRELALLRHELDERTARDGNPP